ncbi:unnamed protein product [Gadus morhua 'NCC']
MCQAGFLVGGSEQAGGCDSECSHPSLRLHLLQGKLSPVPRRREAIWSRWAASTLTSVGDAGASTSDSQRKPPRQTARLAKLELTALVEGWSHRPRCAAATLCRQRSGGSPSGRRWYYGPVAAPASRLKENLCESATPRAAFLDYLFRGVLGPWGPRTGDVSLRRLHQIHSAASKYFSSTLGSETDHFHRSGVQRTSYREAAPTAERGKGGQGRHVERAVGEGCHVGRCPLEVFHLHHATMTRASPQS